MIFRNDSRTCMLYTRALLIPGYTNNGQLYVKTMYTIVGGVQKNSAGEEIIGRSLTFDNNTKSDQATNEVHGLALIGGIVYVVRHNERNIQAYSIDTGLFIRTIVVNPLSIVRDMASCADCKCLYVADEDNNTIHKIQLQGGEQNEDIITKWSVPGVPESLYSKECHLIVSLHKLKHILILNKYGKEVQRIQLHQHPWHAISVMGDMYVFSYTSTESAEKEDKVCLIDKDGNIKKSFEGDRKIRLDKPGKMAATKSGSLFIADYNNDRIVMINSKLEPTNENIIKNIKKPARICFDEGRQTLFIASDNETHDVFVYHIGYHNRFV